MDKRNPPTAPHPPHPHPTPRAHPPFPPPPLLPLSPPPPQRAPATVNVRTQEALEVLAVCKHLISHTASTRSRRRGVGEGAPAARAVLAPSTRVDRPSTVRAALLPSSLSHLPPLRAPAWTVRAPVWTVGVARAAAGRPCAIRKIDPIRGRLPRPLLSERLRAQAPPRLSLSRASASQRFRVFRRRPSAHNQQSIRSAGAASQRHGHGRRLPCP